MKKVCFKCGIEKEIILFYTHSQMKDGHLNKCIDCTKNDISKDYNKNKLDPNWIIKERERGREKNKRLGYAEKYKPTKEQRKKTIKNYLDKFPEKNKAKNYSCEIKAPEGMHKHHWSYNKHHYKDVIFLAPEHHYKAHRYMIYDQERMMYRKLDGVLLDTKEVHIQYIDSLL